MADRGNRQIVKSLPPSRLSAKVLSMKRFALGSFTFLFAAMIYTTAPAQLPSGDRSEVARLDELARKIDLQNAKIDTLSRQILKLEQQISAIRPGVLIGEPAAAAT